MPTALVTGAAGFTGRYLTAALRTAGYDVVGLVQSAQEASNDDFACDLLDRKSLAEVVGRVKPDVVAHLAAIAFVGYGDVESMYRTNISGTRNLLEALTDCDRRPQKVLLVSSANVYGNTSVDPITESVLPAPENDYAVSKLAMEQMARLWFEKLPIVIARPFNYTGVGQSKDFLLPKIVDHFRRREPVIELGNLQVARDFSDVRTVVGAYERLLDVAPAGETFNICSGIVTSLKQVLGLMEEIAGYRIDAQVNPAFVREHEVQSLRGSNIKLVNMIGEIDTPALEATLRWMFEAEVD